MMSIIAVSVWAQSGYMVIFIAGLQAIPNELYEATNDGAQTTNLQIDPSCSRAPSGRPVLYHRLIQGVRTDHGHDQGGPGYAT